VAVKSVRGAQNVELQAGRAEELAPGCELVARGAPPGQGVRLRVVKVTGLSSSQSAVINGRVEAVKPGDLFELDKWVAPDRPNLTVWVPPAATPAEIAAASTVFREFQKRHPESEMSIDPATLSPSHVVSWDGQAWSLRGPGGTRALGRQLSVAAIEAATASLAAAVEKPTFFLQLPPTPALIRSLDLGDSSRNSVIERTAAGWALSTCWPAAWPAPASTTHGSSWG